MVEIAYTRNGLTQWPHHVFCEKEARELREKRISLRTNRALRIRILYLAASDTEYEYISVVMGENRLFRAIKPAWCCSLHVEEEACFTFVYKLSVAHAQEIM